MKSHDGISESPMRSFAEKGETPHLESERLVELLSANSTIGNAETPSVVVLPERPPSCLDFE